MIVGIVAAKAHSNRFPNKNIHEFQGKPLFWHSVQPLLDSEKIDEVVVSTNSDFIKSYCEERGVKVVWRGVNASDDDEPLLGALRYAYTLLDQPYEWVVTIMANCPGHTVETVNKAIDMALKHEKLWEVRSFNDAGEESGLIIFKDHIIKRAPQVSAYLGAVISNIKEIHYESDLHA
ncbi:MAG: NTP transferase domain-containing protein [Microscillaceae bacterium]|nr:NTP transferase domain-containing protein [Microscillaceae bacterium]